MADQLPLTTLLSRVLVAFTIEFDNEFEHRMPHRTTDHSAARDRGPWLVSMAMWFNCMQFVGAEPMPVAELARLARTGTNLDGMRRWGYVFLESASGDPKRKPRPADLTIRATRKGHLAQEVWRPLPGLIEDRAPGRLPGRQLTRAGPGAPGPPRAARLGSPCCPSSEPCCQSHEGMRLMTDRPSRAVRAGSFNAAADLYERGRPPYPPAALDWLLPPTARRVLDLGAGTGKLTRLLVARGLDVVAVEPLEGMRAELARVVPGARVLAGSAERIPLADEAVDAVLAAQAWHWVDPARAVPEVVRVLSPGGTLALLWNERDGRVSWVAELGRIIGESRGQDDGEENTRDHPRVGPPFSPLERHDVPWVHQLTVPELLDMVASHSYVILLPPDERQALLGRVRRLADTDPAVAGRPELSLPYVTQCWRCHRP